MHLLCQKASFAFWIFAIWYTLNVFTCFFHPTHSCGPCLKVSDGQGPCSSSEMQAKAWRNHFQSLKIWIEGYELWNYFTWRFNNINHGSNNTSNDGDIRIERTLVLYAKDRSKPIFFMTGCVWFPCAEFRTGDFCKLLQAAVTWLSWCLRTSGNFYRKRLSNETPNWAHHQLGPKLKIL